ATVWEALAAIETHHEWMTDIESMTFESSGSRGVGTKARVRTRVGPFRTDDVISVVSWVEGESIGISHVGMIKGSGVLAVEADGSGSTVSWMEDLRFPWWLGGSVTGWVARPFLARIWRANLDRLAGRLTSR